MQIALRWVSHHSLLARDKGDNILIGASSVKHLEANLVDLEKGPLPQEGASLSVSLALLPVARRADPPSPSLAVLDALDKAWDLTKDVASPYHR